MTNCRLCGNSLDGEGATALDVPAGTQLFSTDLATARSLKTRISIVECPSCTLIQITGAPVVYEHLSSSSSFVSTELTEHRITQLRGLLRMRSAPEGSGKLLEIGCGDGHLLQQARGIFGSSVGIEPTQRNAQAAADRGLNIRQMLMGRDVDVPGGPFDYFCSFHVLEHVTDVCSVLQGIAKALKADGVGIVEVPSTEAAIEHQRYGDFMPDHLNYFTQGTLQAALEFSGFAVEDIYRDWGNEHLVAYVRKRTLLPRLAYITDRKRQLNELVVAVNRRKLPFAVWGVSHHLLPYVPALGGIEDLRAVDGSSSKVGKYIPATGVLVRPTSSLREIDRGYIALTAPRFQKEIRAELSEMFPTVVRNAQLSEWLGFDVFECNSVAR